jgi:hypothetical protein
MMDHHQRHSLREGSKTISRIGAQVSALAIG